MQLKLLGMFVLMLLLISCASGPAKEDGLSGDLLVPNWVLQTPVNSNSYDVVVVVASSESNDYQFAMDKAKEQINKQLRQDLSKTYKEFLKIKYKQQRSLENLVRTEVINNLPLITMQKYVVEVARFKHADTAETSIWYQLKEKEIVSYLENHRQKLDAFLSRFVNIRTTGDDFYRVLSVIPALPTIAMKEKLGVYIIHFTEDSSLASLPNDNLTRLLNLEVSNSFDHLAIRIDSITLAGEVFERQLLDQLIITGLNMKSFRPDILISFSIDKVITNEGDLTSVVLNTSSEMIASDGRAFTTTVGVYKGLNANHDLALQQASADFADDIVIAIATYLTSYINEVNQHKK